MVQKSDSGTPPEGPRDPFAPPSKDAPDRPWRPRQPQRGYATENPPGGHGQNGHPDGNGGPDGEPQDGQHGQGHGQEHGPNGEQEPGDGRNGRPTGPVVPPPHPWSPGYQGRPQYPYGPQPQAPRFDPSDPVQRRARYALLSGMWGIFFLILGVPDLTLLLGALALYWSVSSLRGTAKTPGAGQAGSIFAAPAEKSQTPSAPPAAEPPPFGTAPGSGPGQQGAYPPPYLGGQYPPYPTKPQLPAAVGGLIASVVGLALVATIFGVQLYYKSFYDCQSNSLTKATYNSCATTVRPEPPQWLVRIGA